MPKASHISAVDTDTMPRNMPTDGSTTRIRKEVAWSVANDPIGQPSLEKQTPEHFQDGKWLIQVRKKGVWHSLSTVVGRPSEDSLRSACGAGVFQCFPCDENGHKIEKLGEIHRLLDLDEPEAAPVYEEEPVTQYAPQYAPEPQRSQLDSFIEMQRMQADIQMARESAALAREQARQDREDDRRREKEDRDEARRLEQVQADKERAIAQAEKDADRAAAAAAREEAREAREERDRKDAADREQARTDREEARRAQEVIEARARSEERDRRDEIERARQAEIQDKAAQRQHEMQMHMMTLAAQKNDNAPAPVAPPDPMSHPLVGVLMQHLLDSKKPDPPARTPEPTLLDQINSMEKIRAALEPFGPQDPPPPPEKDTVDKMMENLPALTGLLAAVRGAPAPAMANPVAMLLSRPELIADAMDADPNLMDKIAEKVNPILEARAQKAEAEAAKKK